MHLGMHKMEISQTQEIHNIVKVSVTSNYCWTDLIFQSIESNEFIVIIHILSPNFLTAPQVYL